MLSDTAAVRYGVLEDICEADGGNWEDIYEHTVTAFQKLQEAVLHLTKPE